MTDNQKPIPLAFESNKAPAGVAGGETLVNLFAEFRPSERRNGPSQVSIYSTPGVKFRYQADGACRGKAVVGDRSYAVMGSKLLQLSPSFVEFAGSIGGSGRCTIDGDDNQIVIASYGEGGYVAVIAPAIGPVNRITDPDFIIPSSVIVIDTYAAWSEYNTGVWVVSEVEKLESYEALDFQSAETKPDKLTVLATMDNEVYLVGTRTVQVHRNVAARDFPFVRLNNIGLDIGSNSPWSVITMPTEKGDSAMFLVDNYGSVRLLFGYSSMVVSNQDVENDIKRVDQATIIGSWFKLRKNFFYVLSCNEWCWWYNTATLKWIEVQTYDLVPAQQISWLCGDVLQQKTETIAFSRSNGTIYDLSPDVVDEASGLVLREITLPEIRVRKPMTMDAFSLHMETGESPFNGVGSNPNALVAWSDNHGKTWETEIQVPMGITGERDIHVELTGLGQIQSSRRMRVRFDVRQPVVINEASVTLT